MAHALTRTHVIAPRELIEEVDRIVGPRRRSEFITDAVAEKLKREKLLQATRKAMALPPVDDVPEWNTPESTAKWLRDGRYRAKTHPESMKYLLDTDTLNRFSAGPWYHPQAHYRTY